MSWATDLSPTTIFTRPDTVHRGTDVMYTAGMVGRVYPGWCSWVVPWRVLYRVLTQPSDFEAYLMNYEV